MALIVEDGSGKPDAESYASVAEANAYHAKMGFEDWLDYSTPEKEVFLRRAMMYLRAAYRLGWKGIKSFEHQAQDWPRTGAEKDGYPVLHNVVPAELKDACAILALKAAAGPLSPDLERAVLREKIGNLEVEYDPLSPQATRFAEIDALLAPLLASSGGVNVKLVRA